MAFEIGSIRGIADTYRALRGDTNREDDLALQQNQDARAQEAHAANLKMKEVQLIQQRSLAEAAQEKGRLRDQNELKGNIRSRKYAHPRTLELMKKLNPGIDITKVERGSFGDANVFDSKGQLLQDLVYTREMQEADREQARPAGKAGAPGQDWEARAAKKDQLKLDMQATNQGKMVARMLKGGGLGIDEIARGYAKKAYPELNIGSIQKGPMGEILLMDYEEPPNIVKEITPDQLAELMPPPDPKRQAEINKLNAQAEKARREGGLATTRGKNSAMKYLRDRAAMDLDLSRARKIEMDAISKEMQDYLPARASGPGAQPSDDAARMELAGKMYKEIASILGGARTKDGIYNPSTHDRFWVFNQALLQIEGAKLGAEERKGPHDLFATMGTGPQGGGIPKGMAAAEPSKKKTFKPKPGTSSGKKLALRRRFQRLFNARILGATRTQPIPVSSTGRNR